MFQAVDWQLQLFDKTHLLFETQVTYNRIISMITPCSLDVYIITKQTLSISLSITDMRTNALLPASVVSQCIDVDMSSSTSTSINMSISGVNSFDCSIVTPILKW